MTLSAGELQTFRQRFEAKEPSPSNFVRRVTKYDYFLTVHEVIEERLAKRFAWQGIADDLGDLGLRLSIPTLKTYVRRARARRGGPTVSAATKKPPRDSSRTAATSASRARAVRVQQASVPLDSVAVVKGAAEEPAPPAPTVTAEASERSSLSSGVDVERSHPDLLPQDSAPPAEDASSHTITPPAAPANPGSREEAVVNTDLRGALPDHAGDDGDTRLDAAAPPASAAPSRRVYKSAINIRREKPLSEFKENSG
jgi:hypothetical protein